LAFSLRINEHATSPLKYRYIQESSGENKELIDGLENNKGR